MFFDIHNTKTCYLARFFMAYLPFILCLSTNTWGETGGDPALSLDELRAILTERIDRATDLSAKIDFEQFSRDGQGQLVGSRHVLGHYRAKPKEGMLWSRRVEKEKDAHQTTTSLKQTAMSFDGQKTYKYRHSQKRKGFVRGWIMPGKMDTFFPTGPELPHNIAWTVKGEGTLRVDDALDKEHIDYEINHRDGRIEVVTRSKENPDFWSRIILDPKQGYLPVDQASYMTGDKLMSRYYMTETVDLRDGVFMPTQAIVDGGENGIQRRVIKLSEISTEPIEPEVFVLKFPDGTRVVDQIKNIAYFTGIERLAAEGMDHLDEEAVGEQIDAKLASADSQLRAAETGTELAQTTNEAIQDSTSDESLSVRLIVALLLGGMIVLAVIRRITTKRHI